MARTFPLSGSLSPPGCLGMSINQIRLGAPTMGIGYVVFSVDENSQQTEKPPVSTAGVLHLKHAHMDLHAPEEGRVNKHRWNGSTAKALVQICRR